MASSSDHAQLLQLLLPLLLSVSLFLCGWRWLSLFLYVILCLSLFRAEVHPGARVVSLWLQNHGIWRRLFGWFPTSLRMPESGAADGRYLYLTALHPHGVMSLAHFLVMTDAVSFRSAALPLRGARRDLAASVLFRIPLLRELLLALGNVDAGARTCHALLERGCSLFLYPGGEHEQLRTDERQPVAFVRRRRGFLRLALQYRARVLPCYVFGEERTYTVSRAAMPLRRWLVERCRVCLMPAWGPYWWAPLVPRRQELVLAVGEPLITVKDGEVEEEVPASGTAAARSYRRTKRSDVSEAEVDQLMERYVAALVALFEQHKKTVRGYESATLEIV